MMIHRIKLASDWFNAVAAGVTNLTIPKEDRCFKPRDTLILSEYDGEKYTGRVIRADVRFVLKDKYCDDGYSTMNIYYKNGGNP